MIRESLYFSFANRKSTDFGIYNVSVSDGGLYEEQITANKSINEITVRGNDKPYFVNVQKEPKTMQLRFSFLETWNDDLIDEVIRWLNVDFYQPLYFSENLDRVFYAMPLDGISLIHNGLKHGYLNLTMRCDSPYSYSHDQVTEWYDFINGNPLKKDVLTIENYGHFPIKPEVWIQKVGDGDLSINNLSYANNKEFKFTGLKDGEELYVDCENEYIETNLPNTYRYDDFSDNYLELDYGNNVLKVTGSAKLKFGYRFIFS